MPSPNRHVPDWLLERLVAGELPAHQAMLLREHLTKNGQTDRLAALAASNAEILETYPADQVVAEVRRRAQKLEPQSKRGWTRPVWALSLTAVGAAAVLIVMHAPPSPQGSVAQIELEQVREKGLLPSLVLYRQTAGGVERLSPTSRLRHRDLVQVRYVAAGKRYGVVASVDSRGSVTLHLPEEPGQAMPLVSGGERALNHAYELDDAPGFERFVFVSADAPFGTDLVIRALKQGAPLPQSLTLWSVTLLKEDP